MSRIVQEWDVVVIGGGPAGLAAAAAAHDQGARVALVEREERGGGILKQCIHDGFGLVRFKEKLTGPEYAWRYLEMVRDRDIPLYVNTFLLEMTPIPGGGYDLQLLNSGETVFTIRAGAVVLATGCRERSDRQIFLQGTRPAGLFTAGQAQYFINIQGYMPAKKCVILGSGDIGLIMARRLTLEGSQVEGVYEILPEPSGLARNIAQCLEDFHIPLHLSTTVTEVHGKQRVEAVTVCRVDGNRKPVPGTERRIDCDALILSVGLIPENDLFQEMGQALDPVTGGPVVDQNMETRLPGVFICGNALHVNDLVDYVSENGETAGRQAAERGRAVMANGSDSVPSATRESGASLRLVGRGQVGSLVPQLKSPRGEETIPLYFRTRQTLGQSRLTISGPGGEELFSRKYTQVKPPEMERVTLTREMLAPCTPYEEGEITVTLEEM